MSAPVHHHPLRAPHTESPLSWYRMGMHHTLRGDGGAVTRLTRHQGADHADLAQFVLGTAGVRSCMHITLSADECELIGCALLDAAHHLRTVPALETNTPDEGVGEADATPGHETPAHAGAANTTDQVDDIDVVDILDSALSSTNTSTGA